MHVHSEGCQLMVELAVVVHSWSHHVAVMWKVLAWMTHDSRASPLHRNSHLWHIDGILMIIASATNIRLFVIHTRLFLLTEIQAPFR